MECHPKLTRENEEGKNIYIKFMEEFLRVKAARTDIKTSWKFTREKIHLKKHITLAGVYICIVLQLS